MPLISIKFLSLEECKICHLGKGYSKSHVICSKALALWQDNKILAMSKLKVLADKKKKNNSNKNFDSSIEFLAPLAEGQRAIVMAWGRRASVRPFVRACVRKLFL